MGIFLINLYYVWQLVALVAQVRINLLRLTIEFFKIFNNSHIEYYSFELLHFIFEFWKYKNIKLPYY